MTSHTSVLCKLGYRSPCLVLHPAPVGVKCLELPSRLDCLPAVCLAAHCTASYDGDIPAHPNPSNITQNKVISAGFRRLTGNCNSVSAHNYNASASAVQLKVDMYAERIFGPVSDVLMRKDGCCSLVKEVI